MELVLDGQGSLQPPTDEELKAWVEAYGLTVTTVRRVDDRTREVFTDREYAYIVDLETMEVVWQRQALYRTPTIIELGVEAIVGQFL